MSLRETLFDLAEQGVRFRLDESDCEKLRISAPQSAFTPELQEFIAQRKQEILSLLREVSFEAVEGTLPSVKSTPQERYQPFPLTDMQHAFWVGRSGMWELGDVANHGYYEIEGENLDIQRLNRALQRLIQRHDMLRAVVLPDGQQKVIEQVPPYQIEVLDLRGKDKGIVDSELESVRQALSHQVLPADQWPLFEFRATHLDEERIRLHVSYDLQIFDAWSLFRLFDEWFQLYEDPRVELKPINLLFRDYVLALTALKKTELYEQSKRYWFNRLENLPPAPSLPLAQQPKELEQHFCKRHLGRLEQSHWDQLKQRAIEAGLTPSGVLLAAFAEILMLWGKSSRFTLNLALFNRLPLHPQVNDIIGDFTSVTLLAVENSHAESFIDRSTRLQKQLWKDLEHRYVSGVEVVRELARRNGAAPSAMPIVFTSAIGFGALGQETLSFSHFGDVVYGVSQASQAWMDVQVLEEKGTLMFSWDVVEGLFPEGLIDAMFKTYGRFLRRLAESEAAWIETDRQIVPPEQLAQRCLVNSTFAPVPEQMLHELFAAQARVSSDKPAIITSGQTLTYEDLYNLSNQVGHRLRSLQIKPNHLVAVVMEKGWEQIVAVMGILAAGAAYVPIDPNLPQERRAYLLENSEANVALTQSWLERHLTWPEGMTRLCLDGEELSNESCEPLEPVQTPDDLAYVIYTSGSTGLPKGVAIAHRGVVNAITHTNQFFDIGPSDRVLALTALHHDMSVYDIFGPLTAGGALVLPDESETRNPAHWSDLMLREQITIWNSVPAMMEMVLEYVGDRPNLLPSSLRWVFLGGDWISVTLPSRLNRLVADAQVVSVGGPTETTLWNIWHPVVSVEPTQKSIPYGRPIANTKYYVLNEALDDCPNWVPGELCCAGVGLAKGYWREEEKTRAKFITHPRTGERIYRTGDMGRYRPDGTIEFLGRVDFQLKIRGYRIEPGEIEAALTQHKAVRSAVVTVVDGQHSSERLVAYVVPEKELTLMVEELRSFLRDKLPTHMVPSAFVLLDALPLSANGKVDRRALPSQDLAQDLEVAYVAPQTDIEQKIATIWKSVLASETVGVNSNFFEIGGNSLLITQVYSQLTHSLPNVIESVPLTDLYKYPTIRTLADYLSTSHTSQNLMASAQSEPLKRVKAVDKLDKAKQRLKQQLRQSKRAQGRKGEYG